MQAAPLTRGQRRVQNLVGAAILAVILGTSAVGAAPKAADHVISGDVACENASASVRTSSPFRARQYRHGIEFLAE
ncbi:MAG: hypothetical protein ACR2LS_04890 [Thermomicrobiales bacterium]